MLAFKKDKKLPDEVLSMLPNGDCMKIISTSPMFAIISLRGINDDEIEAFEERDLTVKYSLIENIPYIILDFDGVMSFDTAFFNIEATKKEEDALNIVLVEENNKTVKGIRIVGLKTEIIERLMIDTKNISLSNEEFLKCCNSIEARYKTEDIARESLITQVFIRD